MQSISIFVLITARASTVVRAMRPSGKNSPEIARVLEVRRDLDHVGQFAARFGEHALHRLERCARLLLDRAGDHVAVRVLAHLAGYVHIIARAHRRMEGQVRVLLAVDLYFRIAHAACSASVVIMTAGFR